MSTPKSTKLANPAVKGEKRRVSGPAFRREFKKLVKKHASQNAAARHMGFKDTTESPLQTLLRASTQFSDTHYADHLAKHLGQGILLSNSKKRTEYTEPPANFTPAPQFITALSDFNLFKISESDCTLDFISDDTLPGLAQQLQQFKKNNPDLFTQKKTWQEAKETLRECDRRWAAVVGGSNG